MSDEDDVNINGGDDVHAWGDVDEWWCQHCISEDDVHARGGSYLAAAVLYVLVILAVVK